MKNFLLGTTAASLLALSGAVSAQQQQPITVQDFEGWYAGAKTGLSRTSIDDADSTDSWTVGLELGHNWAFMHGWIVGANVFYDYNASEDHTPDFIDDAINGDDFRVGTHAYGLSGKLGFVAGPAMYYGKLGAARLEARDDADTSGEGLHAGLGVEFLLGPQWSLTGEWLYTEADIGPLDQSLDNHNFTVGVNFHF
ncbi:porin family protein [Marinimicrobium sp. ABcell2]|uniref:porin family protein n=1 Tax=Marinimicrobium sp. ABcell2 TaxID=3069751 RepID=UPI0027B84948|nr:porin family protein [Marinimicrobium sp. ABcell2]MDQ2075839.1 porin family protein [Marinimicrobium sp. ABcell2]